MIIVYIIADIIHLSNYMFMILLYQFIYIYISDLSDSYEHTVTD